MKIAVIGTGYVGLVSGTCFSHFGFDVTCVDKQASKIAMLQSGQVPIYEPGLEKMVVENAANGHLHFTTNLAAAVAEASAVFVAVGTPTLAETGRADLSYVFAACAEIARCMTDYKVIVIKSTVPVGTAAQARRVMLEANPTADFDVVSNPEFLREGNAVTDFLQPDRVVVGCQSARAEKLVRRLYQPLLANGVPLVITSSESAELIKYAANCYLAMRIGFVNQIADLCEASNADIRDVAYGTGLDRRIGRHYFAPGPGYGGSCFPKDTLAMVAIAQDHGSSVSIIEEVIAANDRRKKNLIYKIEAALGGDLANKNICILGITFKADTDDLRDSPALILIPELLARGAHLRGYDPAASAAGQRLFPDVAWPSHYDEAITNADALVIMTEWGAFRELDIAKIKTLMRGNVIVDFRNLYAPQDLAEAGFRYYSVGRKTPEPLGKT